MKLGTDGKWRDSRGRFTEAPPDKELGWWKAWKFEKAYARAQTIAEQIELCNEYQQYSRAAWLRMTHTRGL